MNNMDEIFNNADELDDSPIDFEGLVSTRIYYQTEIEFLKNVIQLKDKEIESLKDTINHITLKRSKYINYN